MKVSMKPKFKPAHFKKRMERINNVRVKAGKKAVLRAAVPIKKEIKEEIREGAPGGQRFAPLSGIARVTGKGPKNRTPIRRLATGIGHRKSDTPDSRRVDIGFYSTKGKPWMKGLAKIHTQGITSRWSKKQRRYLARIGGRLKKRGSGNAIFFFLRRADNPRVIPARPIIDPYVKSHQYGIAAFVEEKYDEIIEKDMAKFK